MQNTHTSYAHCIAPVKRGQPYDRHVQKVSTFAHDWMEQNICQTGRCRHVALRTVLSPFFHFTNAVEKQIGRQGIITDLLLQTTGNQKSTGCTSCHGWRAAAPSTWPCSYLSSTGASFTGSSCRSTCSRHRRQSTSTSSSTGSTPSPAWSTSSSTGGRSKPSTFTSPWSTGSFTPSSVSSTGSWEA